MSTVQALKPIHTPAEIRMDNLVSRLEGTFDLMIKIHAKDVPVELTNGNRETLLRRAIIKRMGDRAT